MSTESQPRSAPSPSTTSLTAESIREGVRQAVGFLPNAVDEMLVSPPVAAVVLTCKKLLAGASLTTRDQSVIELFIAVRADCAYCRTWHVGLGLRAGIPAELLREIVAGQPPSDERSRQLLWATELVMTKGGRIDDGELAKLAEAGIGRAQLFEIIALVGLNVITNGINTLARTPPDERFVGVLD